MGKTFSVFGTVEEPLFLAKDVADWIEHSNLTVMVSSVDEDEKVISRTKDCLGRENSATFLTENGVYEVLMLSRKPVAKEFKKEVKKMLHALRTKKATLMPTNFADALEAYAKEVRAREEVQKALFAETQQKLAILEQNLTLQKEVDKYVNWKSASEIKSEFKLPYRPGIEKVALLLKLRENEDWIARFYDDTHMYKKILYSPEAVERIVEYFTGED